MSAELVVSIVTAAVSAAASIASALIQANAKGGGESRPAPGPWRGLTTRLDFGSAQAPGRSHGADAAWLVLVLVLIVEIAVLAPRDPEFAAALNSIVLIPLVTAVLAVARPVGWGYAALAVTVLHGAVLVASLALGRGRWASSPQVFLLVFVANALVVSGIAFFRTRSRPAALGGSMLALGALALGWLVLPALLPARGPEPPRVAPGPVRVRPAKLEYVPREGEEVARERAPSANFVRAVRLSPSFGRATEPEREK